MLIRTTRFGALDVEPHELITFPAGLIGLEDCKQWVLLADATNENLGWLQSTTRADTALAVVSPRRFAADYKFRVYRSELAALGLVDLNDAQVLAVVAEHDGELTLNLKAPLVVNIQSRLARQITANDDHPIQFALPSAPARVRKIA